MHIIQPKAKSLAADQHAKADACDWTLLDHDPTTGRKSYFKIEENGDLKIRHTQVMTDEMISLNQHRANDWTNWHGKDHAIVASVPIDQWDKMKRESGWVPGTRNHLDWKHMKKRLNDGDNKLFRTGGGKL